jgi:hypothetical protein
LAWGLFSQKMRQTPVRTTRNLFVIGRLTLPSVALLLNF